MREELSLGLLRTLASCAVLWPPALSCKVLLECGGVLLRALVSALGDEAPRVGEAAAAALVHLARAPALNEMAALVRLF